MLLLSSVRHRKKRQQCVTHIFCLVIPIIWQPQSKMVINFCECNEFASFDEESIVGKCHKWSLCVIVSNYNNYHNMLTLIQNAILHERKEQKNGSTFPLKVFILYHKAYLRFGNGLSHYSVWVKRALAYSFHTFLPIRFTAISLTIPYKGLFACIGKARCETLFSCFLCIEHELYNRTLYRFEIPYNSKQTLVNITA